MNEHHAALSVDNSGHGFFRCVGKGMLVKNPKRKNENIFLASKQNVFEPQPSTFHTCTTLAFSPDLTSTVMTHIHHVLHSPFAVSRQICAQDTEQIHGNHGRGALLSLSCSLFVVLWQQSVCCLSLS